MALLSAKLDYIAGMVSECKVGLKSAMDEMHRQDKEIATIKTELRDFLDFKSAIIKQFAVLLIGGIGLSAVVTYIVQSVAK